MAKTQNMSTSGQGSQNRQPNSKGQKPMPPKNILRAYADVIIGAGNTYDLLIEVSAFSLGQPMANQAVVLKERTTVLDNKVLDTEGEALLRTSGSLTNVEQIKDFRICLTGTAEEKLLTVTIPSIPKIISKPKTISVVPANLAVDLSAGSYSVAFQAVVLEEGKPWVGDVSLKEGVSQLSQGTTDSNGQITFPVVGTLSQLEKNVTYRISLIGSSENVEQNLTVPAAEPKKKIDNDPEVLILRSYHDGCGKFKVAIRILKAHGYGVKTRAKVWYLGKQYIVDTDADGNAVFHVPGVVAPGTSEHLHVSVSGIEDESSVDIKRRKTIVRVQAFSRDWWLGTNNGRAFILLLAITLVWIITLISGSNDPIINHKMFNDDTGLSKAEQLYNESVGMVDNTFMIPADKTAWSDGSLVYLGWLVIVTIFILIYAVLSLREEIAAGIEEGVEKLFNKSYAKSGDPVFERLIKFVGSYYVARKKPVAAIQDSGADDSKPTVTHPPLATLFKLDLLSDALVAIVPAIMKKIF